MHTKTTLVISKEIWWEGERDGGGAWHPLVHSVARSHRIYFYIVCIDYKIFILSLASMLLCMFCLSDWLEHSTLELSGERAEGLPLGVVALV